MQIYHFDAATRILTQTSEAREDPLRPGRYLIPAHATAIAPPALADGMVAVHVDGAWQMVEDHRGVVYDQEGRERDHDLPGPLPDGWSATPPAPPAPTDEEQLDAWRAGCSVSGVRIELALMMAGMTDAMDAFLAGSPMAKAVFTRATTFDRLDPFIVALADAFTNPATGTLITPAEIDALFMAAEGIDMAQLAMQAAGGGT